MMGPLECGGLPPLWIGEACSAGSKRKERPSLRSGNTENALVCPGREQAPVIQSESELLALQSVSKRVNGVERHSTARRFPLAKQETPSDNGEDG